MSPRVCIHSAALADQHPSSMANAYLHSPLPREFVEARQRASSGDHPRGACPPGRKSYKRARTRQDAYRATAPSRTRIRKQFLRRSQRWHDFAVSRRDHHGAQLHQAALGVSQQECTRHKVVHSCKRRVSKRARLWRIERMPGRTAIMIKDHLLRARSAVHASQKPKRTEGHRNPAQLMNHAHARFARCGRGGVFQVHKGSAMKRARHCAMLSATRRRLGEENLMWTISEDFLQHFFFGTFCCADGAGTMACRDSTQNVCTTIVAGYSPRRPVAVTGRLATKLFRLALCFGVPCGRRWLASNASSRWTRAFASDAPP